MRPKTIFGLFYLDALLLILYPELMVPGKRKNSSFLASLLITLVEEAALALIILIVLPQLRINLPFWLGTILVLVWALWSFIFFKLGARVNARKPVVGSESLLNTYCKTATLLSPKGYVLIGYEIWKAESITGYIDFNVEVVVVEVRGLTLLVKPFEDTTRQSD